MSDGPGASIELRGIVKAWSAAPAVNGVSLHVPAGSFCALLGPSGCGKTTLLRIVAGLETADRGQVVIGGRDVTALPPAQRGLAMVFQSYALFPHLTVAENVIFGLRARGMARAMRQDRLDRATAMLGLGPFLHRKPSQLSGGQQQRVALGRAVVAEAPICLMDEPLSNLDAQLRAEMRREILDLQRRLGITMLYVTHDQTEAMAMADQVVLLRAGRVEQDAAPGQMYAAPSTSFVAAFLGTPPMNLLPLAAMPGGRGLGGVLLCQADADIAGLRPESIRILPASAPGLPADVLHAEYLGAETVVACAVAGTKLLVRLPGRASVQHGARVSLGFDHADLHLFDTAGHRMAPAPERTLVCP
jgi:sn-glycerol 3-phosphate transport system ATP-binding protein